jgi:hypothetical protein
LSQDSFEELREELAAHPRGVVTHAGMQSITVTRPGYKSAGRLG